MPMAETVAAFDALARDDARLRDGALAIAAHHGLTGDVARFASGSLPVFAVGQHVLKLFPPCYAHEAATEHDALAAVAGKLAIPTPAVQGHGEHEGWRYVLMSRLVGQSLAPMWPTLPPSRREGIAEEVGAALQALHAIDVRSVGQGVSRPDWSAFMATQRAECVERQRARGLAENWLAHIPDFLAQLPPDSASRTSLLHTEVMREHLLIDDGGALSGLFDFEPAMIGDADYDIASVGIFVTCGERALVRRFVAGYGRDPGPQRFMAYALLHRFSSLRWYLERVPPPAGVVTLDALAEVWWPQ